MIKEQLSDWDKKKITQRLKKTLEQSKSKCFSKEFLVETFDAAESLGYHVLFDYCQNEHYQHTNDNPTFGNFRLVQLAELPD